MSKGNRANKKTLAFIDMLELLHQQSEDQNVFVPLKPTNPLKLNTSIDTVNQVMLVLSTEMQKSGITFPIINFEQHTERSTRGPLRYTITAALPQNPEEFFADARAWISDPKNRIRCAIPEGFINYNAVPKITSDTVIEILRDAVANGIQTSQKEGASFLEIPVPTYNITHAQSLVQILEASTTRNTGNVQNIRFEPHHATIRITAKEGDVMALTNRLVEKLNEPGIKTMLERKLKSSELRRAVIEVSSAFMENVTQR